MSPACILNIAHRGARAFAPENTLISFAKAKTLGCEMVELDVRLSKDGEVVVFHDDHLLRCTDASIRFPDRDNYNLSNFTYKELLQLDAGSWYVEQLGLCLQDREPFLQILNEIEKAAFVSPSQQAVYASGDIKIPRLAEAFCLAKELGLRVNVELKSQGEGVTQLVAAVLRIVKVMAMENQIIISSFDHEGLRQIRQQTKKMAIGVLTDTPIHEPIAYLRTLDANAYNLACYSDIKSNGLNELSNIIYFDHIKKIRNAGFDINIWTCNDPEQMMLYCEAGITGLISDYPNRVRETVTHFASKDR